MVLKRTAPFKRTAVSPADLAKERRLTDLTFQIANEVVKWTEALQAEKEHGGDRATLALLEREAALMSLAMTYKSHRDVYYGLAEEKDDGETF